MTRLVEISADLASRVDVLEFPSVPYVYNPLVYAWDPHEAYLERWGRKMPREVVMVGMNPGPFGMAQTGVPFGDVAMVSDFVGVTGHVARPEHEHPARPIAGFACRRSEVSGTRFWGWARDRFGTLMALGITGTVFWSAVINVGMTTGLLPVVGIPLPFFSYGGSSLLCLLIGIGLMMNLSMRRSFF